jgi:hypothetical protein
VHDASMGTDYLERVIDWHDELLRIAPRLSDLPEAAREAVYAVVEDFLREDAGRLDAPRLPQAA